MNNLPKTQQVVACHLCDAIFDKPQLKQGQSAKCQRCGSTLVERKVDSINRSYYWSIAGIILLAPAILLPIMGVTLAKQYHNASLLDCILVLIDRGFFMIATLVFLFAIAVPIVRLFGAFYIAISFKYRRLKPSMLNFFRAYHHLDNWAMLNVFMLGIIVSMYKLIDDTELSVNLGLLSLVLWLICTTMASLTLDQDYIWETLEQEFADEDS
ncbi:paraquat-inducible protein A [Litorilituus lipolyticus]|uniref:Paraquat-inducible protein A n=1 Tax=Litorilituus lipolyticus TaxID=2491017 RepID=A0A502KUP7_9GAMM|nr:paraquat-inducible protein A [Litorilituus lipolyticus]TPH13403.1 paraquat-inducible protein A [Litorilituus lipolyticus]